MNNIDKNTIIDSVGDVLKKIRENMPIVYQITNSVTINDCANATLGFGGSPIMSFCDEELEDILSFSSALVINIGTMDEEMIRLAPLAGRIANKLNKPIVLDPVGVGASKARRRITEELLEYVKFSVIKGNMAEINSIYGVQNNSNRGVDSIEAQNNAGEIAINLAKRLNCTIAITGKEDIISNGNSVIKLGNGVKELGKITGAGCMSGALIGCGCGVSNDYFSAALVGVASIGIAGEMAKEVLGENCGNGSFRSSVLDSICYITSENLYSLF